LELKDNTVIVVLGASGDLAKKKTVRILIFFTASSAGLTRALQFPALFGLVGELLHLGFNSINLPLHSTEITFCQKISELLAMQELKWIMPNS
jgi:hypothetical protein